MDFVYFCVFGIKGIFFLYKIVFCVVGEGKKSRKFRKGIFLFLGLNFVVKSFCLVFL